MEDFLRKLQLSESAIKIYLKSLGKTPLTYYELYSIVPKVSTNEFKEIINDLLNSGLLLKQEKKKKEGLTHYLPIPPILPILNYYENITANLPTIKNSIQELMINSINEIFKKNKGIELDTILKTFQEIKKDIDEDSIIERQEIEDLVREMEVLKELNKEMLNLHQNIKGVTQKKFSDLIKTINSFKTDLIEGINSLEFKKHKQEIIKTVEKIFKVKFESMVKDFINNLQNLIANKLDETSQLFGNTLKKVYQYREDFKIHLLDMLSNFETKMNKIHELIKENKEDLFGGMKNLEIKIVENLNSIIQNSINEVSSLNNPIEHVLKKYFQKLVSSDSTINNIWIINSVTKINEEIQKIINNSKEEITIIIPNLENYLAIEQLKEITSNITIKIASSEAHTNSLVKKFKNINNLTYKTLQNDELILAKADNNQIVIGIKQDSKDILSNFIGIGSNFEPFITLLNPALQSIWEHAYTDTFYATQKAKTKTSTIKPTTIFTPKVIKKKIVPKIDANTIVRKSFNEGKQLKSDIIIPSDLQDKKEQTKIKNIPKKIPEKQNISPPPLNGQIKDLKKKLQEKVDFLSAVRPKRGDNAAVLIDTALNNLIQKINNLKGNEISKELQNIADLILEKKGFSVTLHKIRITINNYKNKITLLDENDKKDIFQEIETWKQKLF